MKRVLIIDDELARPGSGELFKREYPITGVAYEFCGTLEEANRLQYWNYALVLLDIRFEGLGDEYGITLLELIRERTPSLPVVMLSSRTTPEILIRCWDKGAQAYIVKWTSNQSFHYELVQKVQRYARYLPNQAIIGESSAIRNLRETISTLSGYDISVLVTGESGTGKELVARALHEQGKRKSRSFVAVNSAAIPSTLLESEMFGHVKGAFTGATDRRGKVEEADGGTLFLDEIADLPLEMQVKLLRLLDTGEYVRVGENKPRHTDIRIVAATNQSLEDQVAQKNFREDLFFRLNGFSIKAPSLRQHLDDLPLLAEHFLELFKNTNPQKNSVVSFSSGCIKAMQAYPWPGNVRELRNAVERAVILTTATVVELHTLPDNIYQGISHVSRVEPFAITSTEELPADPSSWSQTRILAEIHLCLEAKRRIKEYKGKYWKAEFMRLMFPECKASNAKGFDDFIRRLTKSPWGNPRWGNDSIEIKSLVE